MLTTTYINEQLNVIDDLLAYHVASSVRIKVKVQVSNAIQEAYKLGLETGKTLQEKINVQ